MRVGTAAGAMASAVAVRVSAALSRLALALVAMLAIHEIAGAIRVVDGDTVDRFGLRWRLTGLDAPEIGKAKCTAERVAGHAAAARLRELVAGAGNVRLVPVERRIDKWGRVVGRLEVDGADVAALLIAEGHARAYDGRSKRQGWCG